jgi:hypothetical protein
VVAGHRGLGRSDRRRAREPQARPLVVSRVNAAGRVAHLLLWPAVTPKTCDSTV